MTEYATDNINFKFDNNLNLFIISIDIGGTLAKLVYSPLQSNILHFKTFETDKIDDLIKFIHSLVKSENNDNWQNLQIIATGGGAFKFYDLLMNEFVHLNVNETCSNQNVCSNKIFQFDEMECLIKGLNFCLNINDNEIFTYNDSNGINYINIHQNSNSISNSSSESDNDSTSLNLLSTNKNENYPIYPYMLVNIGSGVSILKVTAENIFTRIGGSSLGGGTLWGLLSLITGAKTYDEMLTWAQSGDNTNVDMLVGDIYGTDYNKIGLKSSSIASSFGKVFQSSKDKDKNKDKIINETAINSPITTCSDDIKTRNKNFKNQDISKSLLYAISNNIGQIAYLQAKIHKVKNIYFGGSYIRGHLTTMNTLSYAINFWSDGKKQAFFLKHEGYLGAIGAFLKFLHTSIDLNSTNNSNIMQFDNNATTTDDNITNTKPMN